MTLSAVLLAGGESRRMGRDKAQVIFEGQPLWQRQIQLLRQLEPEELFLSMRPGQTVRGGLAELAPPLPKTELLLDEFPSRGPMSGITAALRRMKTSHLLVLAVDMPFIVENDLQHLVSLTRPDCGVVPRTIKGAEPLVAVYPRNALSEFTAALSSRSQSMQRLVDRLAELKSVELIHFPPLEAERYRSVNALEDLIARTVCR
jgi:molybdopterin-guanine dinucleotide biosynthesis protein A